MEKVAMKLCIILAGILPFVRPPSCAAETLGRCAIEHDWDGSMHRITIAWEAMPKHFYHIRTVTDFNLPWGLVAWIQARGDGTNSFLTYTDQSIQPRRFYEVVDLPLPDWLTNSTELLSAAERWRLIYVSPGTFTMGSATNEAERFTKEGPQTEVTISRGFWMGRYEVTQGEYLDVMRTNPSYSWGTNLPVQSVSWYDATNYCGCLTERERQAGRLPVGYDFRLPTEAEWEYACRAGTTTAFHYGPALRSGMANFFGMQEYDSSVGAIYNSNGTYLGETTVVGSYAPNPWGLYDMHGNVWEWCLDWSSDVLPGGSVTDPTGPADGWWRVDRGGSYDYAGSFCRSARRNQHDPNHRNRNSGFRVVLAPVRR